jgi:RsiW-degrading membrane proteinase PrsW (M82 family)
MNIQPTFLARWSTRHIIVTAGVVLWLGSMFFKTGGSGFIALATAALFMAGLIILGSTSRTVTLRHLLWLFLMGGAMMGVGYLGGMLAPDYPANAFVIPPMEETLKLAPVLWILWQGRRARTWSVGVTDVMLMGAASGAGFALVEDAYIRHAVGWSAHLAWLPITEISGGRLIVGHAIWTALAGMTIGWALLLRNRGKVAIGLGVCGYVWSILDHAANNYAVHVHGWSANFLNIVTGYGWISIWLFSIGFIGAIAIDLYIVHKAPPSLPEGNPSSQGSARGRVGSFWTAMLIQRMLAFLFFQFGRESQMSRTEIADFAAQLHASMSKREASPAAA